MKFARFQLQGKSGFGVLEGAEMMRVYEGDMFQDARATSTTLALSHVTLLTPCQPSKMVALWNNSRIQIDALKRETPKEGSFGFSNHHRLLLLMDNLSYTPTAKPNA